MPLAPTDRNADGDPPRRGLSRYGREIAVVLVVKLVAIVAIWHVWFSGPARRDVQPADVATRVYSSGGDAKSPAKEPHAARP